tara:strand:+ start:153 stop:458 length:306 start_codon:yes stop_codon:yes gene_type:complete
MPGKNHLNLKYLKVHSSLLIKLVAFTGLGIAGYIDLIHSNNNILEDPFLLGAFSMAIASLLTLINPKIYYVHTAMFFFILTKLISQYTHSKHYDFWGHKLH